MRQINLLPPNLKPGKKVKLAIKKVEKYFILAIVLYLLLVSSSVAYILHLERIQKDLLQQKNSLSAEIKGLSNVETSTVYIRDRVSKFDTLGDRVSGISNLDRFEKLNSVLLPTLKTSDVVISANTAVFSVDAMDTSSLAYFLNKIVEMDLYKNISLSAISYSKSMGYSFSVSIDF